MRTFFLPWSAVKRLRVAPNAEYLAMLYEECRNVHQMHPLEIVEQIQRFCFVKWDPKIFLQYARILEAELSTIFKRGDTATSPGDDERLLKLIEDFMAVYMMQYSAIDTRGGANELPVHVAHIFAFYLFALDRYFRVHDNQLAIKHNRRVRNRMKQNRSRGKGSLKFMRERPTKETVRAQLDRLFGTFVHGRIVHV